MPDSNSGRKRLTRRKALKGAAAAGAAALAGCSGQSGNGGGGGSSGGSSDGGSSDGGSSGGSSDGGSSGGEDTSSSSESEAWPPGRGSIEVLIPVGPGDSRDVEARVLGAMWERGSDAVRDADITVRYTNNPGALGLLNYNRAWNADADGTSTSVAGSEAMYMLQVADSNAEWNTQEFRPFDITRQKPRGAQVSHHSTSVDGHFQWDWDDWVSNVQDLTFGASSPHQAISMKTLLEFADETEQEDLDFVNFGSGSEVRAEVLAGNLDGYVGGYGTNMPRAEYYKTQFAFNSEDMYPNLYQQMIDQAESLHGVGDSFQAIGDFDLTDRALTNAVEVSNGATAMYCPPGTPDEVMNAYYEITEWGYGDEGEERDETMYQEMRQARGVDQLNEMVFSQIHGEDAAGVVEGKAEIFLETDAIVDIVEENLG
ncbi:twin-arginine translocation signal domain-containing protein [Salinigranum halophilum]|uniref:twin-arginine translocation signal domain-containing protein n=1 Tax=Salinigranum halophilum TaxID=2565931 RepID=UPI0010A85EE7|nr:twin-arginine translocation signal domain-containing protein [Salinigranum halophilum]